MRRKTLLSILLAAGLSIMNSTMASIEPISQPSNYTVQETQMGFFYITRYRTPNKKNYKTWYDFYKATRKEGYSIDGNRMYSSRTIQPTEEASKSRKRDHGGSCIGHTKSRTQLIIGESIAVDSKKIPRDSIVNITFFNKVREKYCRSKQCYHYEPCTTQSCLNFKGTYLANDIGVKGNHIDVFTGLELGTHKGRPFSLGEDLPSYAQVTIIKPVEQNNTQKLLGFNRPPIFYQSSEIASQDKSDSDKVAYRKK